MTCMAFRTATVDYTRTTLPLRTAYVMFARVVLRAGRSDDRSTTVLPFTCLFLLYRLICSTNIVPPLPYHSRRNRLPRMLHMPTALSLPFR
jgi:hypothetical protein